MIALPEPRGAVTALLLDALAGPVRPLPAAPAPSDDEDLQLALYLCYELHYRGLPGVDERWEWEPSLLGAARRAGARASRRRCGATCRCRPASGAMDLDAARDRGRRRRALALEAPRARRHARAVPRVRGPPLGLPAQGGRPALVGAAAAERRPEGGAGGDPGGRVRRRRPAAHPRPALRRRDGRPRSRQPLRRVHRPTSPPSRWQPSTSCRCSDFIAACAERSSATSRCSR